jgi:hypothetical protein
METEITHAVVKVESAESFQSIFLKPGDQVGAKDLVAEREGI